ncbi:hypothetical protein [Thalassospira tepidiphila]|jgi:hypothetical protein|uniref:hypothetical protein n=1 Tax=Thalassospira tepidiphila TaxID=393657 RepID=UPI00291FC191|nr:hypothetical protein MACH01_11140 [Thalassospira tepidiphila]
MKFDITIWSEAVDVIRANLALFAVVVGLVWLADTAIYAFQPDAQIPFFVTFFAGIYLAVASHATILRNISGYAALKELDKKAFQRFMWRTGAIAILGFIPSMAVLMAVIVLLDGVIANKDAMILIAMMAVLVGYGVVTLLLLSLIGTWLPAAIVADGSNLKQAFLRGRKTIAYVITRLLIGPGGNVLLFLITLFLLPVWVPDSISGYTIKLGVIQLVPFDIVLNGFANLVWATGTVLIAVVLSRAYLLGEAGLPKTNEQREELATSDVV